MVQFSLFTLNYPLNLLENYQRLSHLPGFVLLESSDQTQGRYDIVSAYPYDQVVAHRHASSLLQVFEALQQRLKEVPSVGDLPFQGGAIGYFSYDFGAMLRGIHSTPQPALQELPLLVMGLYDWALIIDHWLKKVTLFAANEDARTPSIVEEILSRWDSTNSKETSFTWSGLFAPLQSKTEYQDAFHAIYQALRQGRCYQVNYTQPFFANYQGDSWAIYKQVRTHNPVPYSAFLHMDDMDILSFSPERFLSMDESVLLTSPIKGTERRGKDAEEDKRLQQNLLESAKNRAENIMIVDLLRNDLGKIAQPGSVRVRSLCEIQSYQGVHHLVSHIEANCLKNIGLVEAFAACFPGGSITGAPKLESMRVIKEYEPYARGVYCGNIGYFSRHGRFDSNIAIRMLLARNESLHLATGGGIVIDSNCEDEYLECFSKMVGILRGLR